VPGRGETRVFGVRRVRRRTEGVTKLAELFDIYPTVAAALEAFRETS
jgi:hypothetical protein